jgi:UDPglucose 6-dehydrogenase
VYDPRVDVEKFKYELLMSPTVDRDSVENNISNFSSAYDACTGADAIVVATEWDE